MIQLWRIDGLTADAIQLPAQLVAGLRLHVAHAVLMTIEVRVAPASRRYLGLPACSGCSSDRCVPGCHADLFRRLLRATAPTVTLTRVHGGLAARPYTQCILLHPQPQAVPLALPPSADGDDMRLIVVQQQRGTAALLLSTSKIDIKKMVQTARWRAWTLPAPMVEWGSRPIPPVPTPVGSAACAPLLFDECFPRAPTAHPLQPHEPRAGRMVLPRLRLPINLTSRHADHAEGTAAAADTHAYPHTLAPLVLPDEPPAVLARLIALALSAPASSGAPVSSMTTQAFKPTENLAQDIAADGGWPTGPNLTPGQVQHVVQALLADGEVRTKGVTRKMLKGLAPGNDMALFVWFDQAHLFAEPHNTTDPAQRWRERRHLMLDEAEAIAAQLQATALPNEAMVTAAITALGG